MTATSTTCSKGSYMLDVPNDASIADFGDGDALEINEPEAEALDVELLETLLRHSGTANVPDFMAALSDAGVNMSYRDMIGLSRAVREADEYNAHTSQPTLWNLRGDAVIEGSGIHDDYMTPVAVRREDDGFWRVIPNPPDLFPEAVREAVIARWEDEREGGGFREILSLCRAVETLIELKRLMILAEKSGGVQELWDYPYDLKPEVFDGCLPIIHSILTNGSRTVSERAASLVCEDAHQGSWTLITDAVWKIDGDYESALKWSSRSRSKVVREKLGSYDATVDRYWALVGAAGDASIVKRLKRAIKLGRQAATTVTTLSKPTERFELVGQGVGQGHFSELILEIAAGNLTADTEWDVQLKEGKGKASVRLSALDGVPDLFKQIGEGVILTDGGILSVLGAVYQAWTRASEKTAQPLISTAVFVREHRATSTSERAKHKASDFLGAAEDIDLLLTALSRIHVDVTYYEQVWGEGNSPETIRHELSLGPLFNGRHLRSVNDNRGNLINSAWLLNPQSMDFFRTSGLVRGERVPLLTSGGGNENRRLSAMESAFYTFVINAVATIEWKLRHGQEPVQHFDRHDLIYLGKCRPPDPADKKQRAALRKSELQRLDRLSNIILDPKGRPSAFLRDIMDTCREEPSLPTIDIEVHTKLGNRRKVGPKGNKRELPPKIRVDGLDITLVERATGSRKIKDVRAVEKSEIPTLA